MKNIIFAGALAAATVVLMAGCSRDPDPVVRQNEAGSTLETEGSYKISSFKLPADQLILPDGSSPVMFQLTSHTNGDLRAYDGRISAYDAQTRLCKMMIPLSQVIPDGDYSLKFRTGENRFLNVQFAITVRSEMISRLLESRFIYGIFAQQGSSDDPYLVTDDLFFDFLYTLRQDPAHGEGSYFLQTENITANQQGDDADGRGFANESFAGTYDGSGHTLELSYAGTRSAADHALGLFRELKDKAIVKNLVLQPNIARVSDTVGVVAAFSTGDVLLDNLTVKGTVSEAGNMVGGLIGLAKDGNVTIRSATPETMITGAGNEVGGLIGRVENAVLTISNTGNDEQVPFKFIEGKECVGGAVGLLKGSFSFSNVEFAHTVSSQDQSLKIIQGNKHTGGLIGKAEIDADCSLSGVTIAMPVYGGDCTGGFIGELSQKEKAGVNIDFCAVKQSGSVVSGQNYVGGFIGSASIDFAEFNKASTKKSLLGAKVEGLDRVGGIFGYCWMGRLKINPGLKIEGNIAGRGEIGGFAGWFRCDDPVQLGEGLESVPTMNITGYKDVGGFAGYAENSEIAGDTEVTPDAQHAVANESWGNSVYSGKINSSSGATQQALNAGGMIGSGKNVTLKNLYVTASVYGQSYVGGIAGQLEGSSVVSCVSRCGKLQGSFLGGIVGYLSSARQVERLVNYSAIAGGIHVGGVAGHIGGSVTLEKCVNLGAVTGATQVGGIAGYGDWEAQIIADCANFGAVSSSTAPTDESGIGGIMGKNASQCTIRGCTNRGQVSVTRGDSKIHTGVGGIAGYLGEGGMGTDYIRVERCCNFGVIETSAGSTYRNRLGGIVGYMRGGSPGHDNKVLYCYNRGKVNGRSKDDNGGITGTSNNCTAATYSYNSGPVAFGNGGVGHRESATDAIDTHYLYIELGSGGEWKATTFHPMYKSEKSSYEKFDFNTVWNVDGTTNDGYPFLRDCYYQFAVAP